MMRPAPQKEGRASADRPEAVAFVEDESSRELIGRALSEFMFSNVGIKRGNISTAISQLAEQRSPRLLIVDISNVDLPLSSIAELAEVCEPGVTVVAIGDRNDVGLFRELINSGIRDYLVKPLTYQLLHRSLLNIVQDVALPKQTTNLGRVTVFLGARGGVGTTTLATSCGWEIARQRHRRVGLLDLDLHFGSAALALDLDPSHVLREALDDPSRIDGLFVDRAMMKHSPMFYVLAGEEPLSEMVPLGRAGIELVVAELRAKFHYVLIDMP